MSRQTVVQYWETGTRRRKDERLPQKGEAFGFVGQRSVEIHQLLRRPVGGDDLDRMQHRPSPRYWGRASTVTEAVTRTQSRSLRSFCVGIAAQEAEERDVIRAADHAEPAGTNDPDGTLPPTYTCAEADGLAVVLCWDRRWRRYTIGRNPSSPISMISALRSNGRGMLRA